MNTKPILYDLGISLGAIGLWLTPFNASRILGYSVSLVFAGDAYYRGICLLSKERKEDEKQAIAYEAETDFYDQLLGSNIEAELEVRALQVENRMLARMIPLMQQKTQLERQLQHVAPVHPEMSEEEREEAARTAIDSAFTDSKPKQEITEEDIRKQFPESMDNTSWKAIIKALQGDATKADIVKDVLGCSGQSEAIGNAYFELLQRKFLG